MIDRLIDRSTKKLIVTSLGVSFVEYLINGNLKLLFQDFCLNQIFTEPITEHMEFKKKLF